jgi:hypothetical protein
MKVTDINPAVLFLIRRACRTGSTRRADLIRFYPAAQATHAKWMKEALGRAQCIERQGAGSAACLAFIGGPIPVWAGFESLLTELEGDAGPEVTGVLETELPIFIAHWTRKTPLDPTALGKIIQAIAHEKAIVIRYVGLRKGEKARLRRIFPAGLERMGDQWRLIGSDLEKPGYPLRVFVLARILGFDAEISPPKGFVIPGVADQTERLPVHLNSMMTSDQAVAIAHELGIVEGCITINSRSKFEFYRRFADQIIGSDVVWPLLQIQEE